MNSAMKTEKSKLKIKKGDIVQVISGSDKGKTGRVLEVIAKDLKVLVEGVNTRKKHVKPTQTAPQGGVMPKDFPIHYSKVMLLDSKGKPTRIGIKQTEKAGKSVSVRVAKTTGEEIAAANPKTTAAKASAKSAAAKAK